MRRKLLKRKIVDGAHKAVGSILQSSSSGGGKSIPSGMRGWISKEGGAVRRSFNNRYFVLSSTLTSSTLTYYIKSADNGMENGPPYGINERGKIDLRGSKFIEGTNHCRVIDREGKKQFILDLKSSPDRDEWIKALKEHIDYANHLQHVNEDVRRRGDMSSFADMGV